MERSSRSWWDGPGRWGGLTVGISGQRGKPVWRPRVAGEPSWAWADSCLEGQGGHGVDTWRVGRLLSRVFCGRPLLPSLKLQPDVVALGGPSHPGCCVRAPGSPSPGQNHLLVVQGQSCPWAPVGGQVLRRRRWSPADLGPHLDPATRPYM